MIPFFWDSVHNRLQISRVASNPTNPFKFFTKAYRSNIRSAQGNETVGIERWHYAQIDGHTAYFINDVNWSVIDKE
jgi:hypothetical protein